MVDVQEHESPSTEVVNADDTTNVLSIDPEKQLDQETVQDGSTKDDQPALDETETTAAQLLVEDIPWRERFIQVVKTYAPLGLVAFGGPQAHVAILRDHLVVQRKWLDEEQFTELFAIGQGLPGPTSTQLVVSTALARAGPIGGITAFMLWNLPGLIVLITWLVRSFVPEYELYIYVHFNYLLLSFEKWSVDCNLR